MNPRALGLERRGKCSSIPPCPFCYGGSVFLERVNGGDVLGTYFPLAIIDLHKNGIKMPSGNIAISADCCETIYFGQPIPSTVKPMTIAITANS